MGMIFTTSTGQVIKPSDMYLNDLKIIKGHLDFCGAKNLIIVAFRPIKAGDVFMTAMEGRLNDNKSYDWLYYIETMPRFILREIHGSTCRLEDWWD